MLPCPASTLSFIKQLYLFNSYIRIAKQNLKPNQFCKKLAEVIVILNRASSIDKHTKISYKPQPYFLLFQPRGARFRNSPVKNRASTVGKLGYWTSRERPRSGGSEECLAVRFPLHPLAHNYSSIHVCKQNQNYSSRTHR